MYARSCESWRQEKELSTIKHQDNIPYYEAHKLVVGSKSTTYSQTVQWNESPHDKYGMIVKTLIQLELSDWDSSINKIKSHLIPPELQIYQLHQWILQKTKRNHIPKHRPNWGKTNTDEKTTIKPSTRLIKHPVTKSLNKTGSKTKIPNMTSCF